MSNSSWRKSLWNSQWRKLMWYISKFILFLSKMFIQWYLEIWIPQHTSFLEMWAITSSSFWLELLVRIWHTRRPRIHHNQWAWAMTSHPVGARKTQIWVISIHVFNSSQRHFCRVALICFFLSLCVAHIII